MVHKMPRIGSLSLLQDRVFNVLIVTAHSFCEAASNNEISQPSETRQSFTAQLPIDIDSFSAVGSMMRKSNVQKKGSTYYYFPPNATQDTLSQPKRIQPKKQGKKLIQGNYVSLERLREATRIGQSRQPPASSPPSTDAESSHRWDMMTLSKAGGITSLAPGRIQQKETLDAISADVYEAIQYIAEQRLHARNPTLDHPLSD